MSGSFRRMFRLKKMVWAVVLCTAVLTNGAGASPRTVGELADDARLIVVGRVDKLTCRRNVDGRLMTLVTLDVSEVWKGEHRMTDRTLTFVNGGGILGPIRQSFNPDRPYRIGEKAVFFLEPGGQGQWVTVSLWQGRFAIGKQGHDPSKGEKASNNGFAELNDRGFTLSLEELKQQVMEVYSEGR